MTDLVRKLIEDRLKDLGLNMAEVSRRLDMNVTYLQQFLKKGKPRKLPEHIRYALAEMLQVSENELRGTSAPLPTKNYVRSVSGFDQRSNERLTKVSGGPLGTPASEPLFGAFDLPVYGMVHGKSGVFELSSRAVDWVARPSILMRVEEAYSVIVATESMSPVLRTGSTALVNPHLPPRVGDICIFRSHVDGAPDKVLIKEYRGESDTAWKVRKLHPETSVILKKSEWQICHRIVGSYFA